MSSISPIPNATAQDKADKTDPPAQSAAGQSNKNDKNDTNNNRNPPAMYITDIEDINPLLKDLNTLLGDDKFTIHTARSGDICVKASTSEEYRKLSKYCIDKQLKSHTHQAPEDRETKIHILLLHKSTEIPWIKQQIANLKHTITNISRVTHHYSKETMNRFEATLAKKENNKDIYDINKIGNQKIKIIPAPPGFSAPQCHRCQLINHTKNYCLRPYRCCKCGGGHPTITCTKSKDEPPTCANCKGNHTASYKGCPVHLMANKQRASFRLTRTNNILTKNGIPPIPQPNRLNPNSKRQYTGPPRSNQNRRGSQTNNPQQQGPLEHSNSSYGLSEKMDTLAAAITNLTKILIQNAQG